MDTREEEVAKYRYLLEVRDENLEVLRELEEMIEYCKRRELRMYREIVVVLMALKRSSLDEWMMLAKSEGRWMYQGMTERMEKEMERMRERREKFEYIMPGKYMESKDERTERLRRLEEKVIIAQQLPGYRMGETMMRRLNSVRKWCQE